MFGQQEVTANITVNGDKIEHVTEFEYLGSLLTWDNDCSQEIKRRIAKATGAMEGFKTIWKSKVMKVETKLEILRTCIFSVLLYASETWTIKKRDKDRLLAFEMKCYRRILNIRWQQKIKNTTIRERINNKTNIMQILIRRKMNFFGHICRMKDNRLVKKIMLGTMEGENRRGRPRREWLDDIEEWGNAELHTLTRATQDRERWRQIVNQAVDTYGYSTHGAG